MKPVLYLRIASILTLIHSVLHTIGGVFGKPLSGTATMVAATIRLTFPAFGAMRSYADFYRGMGLAVTIFLMGYLAMAVNSYTFFFSGPVIAELLIVACIAAAIVTARPAVERELTSKPGFKTAQL